MACLFLPAAALLPAETLSPVQRQRYCMGTMFNIIVYHPSAAQAARAIERAMTEIVRLDGVMSHYKADSDLSRLNREGRAGFVAVEPSLYEVIEESLVFSRRSGGTFDVTIAPLLRIWKEAHAAGRTPSAGEISEAARCVGYELIETAVPDRVRFRSDCLELDLGGIGKGYAVDRALAVLRSEGVRHAMVNAGGSTIAASGAPPGKRGWPIQLGAAVSGSTTLLLRDRSISTSQQNLVSAVLEAAGSGEIIDPHSGAPTPQRTAISVVTATATASDALATTLVMLPMEEGTKLLEQFADVSALWISPAGMLQRAYRASGLQLADSN